MIGHRRCAVCRKQLLDVLHSGFTIAGMDVSVCPACDNRIGQGLCPQNAAAYRLTVLYGIVAQLAYELRQPCPTCKGSGEARKENSHESR